MTKTGLLLAIATILLAATAARAGERPYTLVIVAEPGTEKAALKLRQQIKRMDPFSRMGDQFVVKIKMVSAGAMKCDNASGGGISCNDYQIREAGRSWPLLGDSVIAMPMHAQFRSSASTVVHLDYHDPPTVALHEFMHELGFGDEYGYQANREPDQFKDCADVKGNTLNNAMFRPHGSYASSQELLAQHGSEIPWARWIPREMNLPSSPDKIESGEPIDPYVPRDYPYAPGLYESDSCNGQKVYSPYVTTIMRESEGGKYGELPPLYKDWIVAQMSAVRGAPIQLRPPIDSDCLVQLKKEDLAGIPALRALEGPLKEKIAPLISPGSRRLSKGLLKAFPKLQSALDDARKKYPDCMSKVELAQDGDGNLVFGNPATDLPRDPYSALDPSNRHDFLQYMVVILNMSAHCSALEQSLITVSLWNAFPEIDWDNPIWRGAVLRAGGRGESASIFHAETSASNLAACREALTPELCDRYVEALKANDPEQPSVCRAVLARRNSVPNSTLHDASGGAHGAATSP